MRYEGKCWVLVDLCNIVIIHLKYYPSGCIAISSYVFIGGGRGGMVGVGGVWIHLLLLLYIYTLPVTDKVIDFFQDHIYCP